MKKGIRPLWFRVIIFYVILSLLPPLAMADQGVRLMSAPHAFIIPLQEEGLLDVPVIKKPWYKKWWVWAIVIGVAGGAAAVSGEVGEAKTTQPTIQ